MKKIKVLLSVLLLCAVSVAFAQTTVKGVVSDSATGEPVPAASVIVKGTLNGVVAGIDGDYSISVPDGAVLVFSSVGYKTAEVSVAGKTTVNCALEPDAEFLNDVVVVAYGTQSAKTVTAAVSTVKADALKDAPNVSFDSMLQGQAAGVQVATPNAGSGQSAKILIRGVSSISGGTDPLYIVDGMPISSSVVSNLYTDASALSDINPADILSIDVLKDAAATALYGSRAASGVVIITTKSGHKGDAKVTYDMNIGVAQPTNFFKMMDADQYVAFKNMAIANAYGSEATDLGGGLKGEKTFNIMKWEDGSEVRTNWADLIFQKGLVQNHTVSIQGGSDKTQYYMSANFADQNGIVIGDLYKRYGIKANVSTDVNKWLKVGLSAQYSNAYTQAIDASRQDGVFSAAGQPRMAMIIPPILPAYNQDGSYYVDASGQYIDTGATSVRSFGYPNPMSQKESYNKVKTNRVIASGFAEVSPIQNLKLKSQFGIDYMDEEEETFWDPKYGQGAQYPGYACKMFSDMSNWTWTNTASYDLAFGENSFSFLAGMEANKEHYNMTEVVANTSLNTLYDGFAAGYEEYIGDAALGTRTIESYFARVNYDYKAKYMASVNFRRDGLSALGANSRWGNFYGASAAWRISEESFFAPLRAYVDELKINASYGVVGNAEIGYYNAQSYYSDGTYGGIATVGLGNIGDAGLAWESSTKYDVGVSASFINRIDVDFDWYYTKSDNLVMAVPQGPSTGIGSLVTNAGSLENKGIEITIGATVISTRDFSWNTSFNFTSSHNKVLELAEGVDAIYGGDEDDPASITIPGYSIGQLYVFPTGGIDPENGRRVFYGSNGEYTTYDPSTRDWYLKDGTSFQGDITRVRCGNTLPTFFGGWSNNFKYKNFDLNILMQFSGGNYIFNGNTATGSDMRWWNNFAEVADKCWQKPGDKAKYAYPIYSDNVSNGSAYELSDWIERGDYLRMKSISLGYTFNTGAKRNLVGFRSVRVYGQVQNAFVITGYTGIDPELTSSYSTQAVLAGGYDKNTLPQARTWTAGVQLTF